MTHHLYQRRRKASEGGMNTLAGKMTSKRIRPDFLSHFFSFALTNIKNESPPLPVSVFLLFRLLASGKLCCRRERRAERAVRNQARRLEGGSGTAAGESVTCGTFLVPPPSCLGSTLPSPPFIPRSQPLPFDSPLSSPPRILSFPPPSSLTHSSSSSVILSKMSQSCNKRGQETGGGGGERRK